MALEIINRKIVGTIENLENKLEGTLPVTREELIYLINSWGRLEEVEFNIGFDNKIKIDKCEAKECYDLSSLDVSQIRDMENLFRFSLFNGDISDWNISKVTNMNSMFAYSNFNGDISKWDTSNVTSMEGTFLRAKKFNSDIGKWNISNVKNMSSLFFYAENFNSDISKWNLENIDCDYMFDNAKAFYKKFNNNIPLPSENNDIKEWLNNNRDIMKAIDTKANYKNEVDNFFSNFSNIELNNTLGR